jgi:hypothetical protein
MAMEESSEIIDKALIDMEEAISTRITQKPAYDEAIRKGSRYVRCKDFRLKFIRASMFNISKAASSFVKYLDLLFKYYGPDALMRPLYVSDLNHPELELLRAGHMQLLPTRDRSGRRVLNVFGAYRKDQTVFSKVRNKVKERSICVLLLDFWTRPSHSHSMRFLVSRYRRSN